MEPNTRNLTVLFIASLLIRLAVFLFFILPNEYYKQPDSNDYHHSALSLGLGRGMRRLDNNRPTFWRTPGYPIYLSFFYKAFGIKRAPFSDNWPAQTAAIIFQIILGALIPLLIFFLALMLTKTLSIAWITAWICAIHLGFVLQDSYILTESLAIFFFIPFYIYFFKSFYLPGAKPQEKISSPNSWIKKIILAALFLAAATWIRPMGHFLSIASVIMILVLDSANWKIRLAKTALFLGIFFLLISPWYIRNYNITGKLFYCPMFGLYLNTFNAPKIIRKTQKLPLGKSREMLYAQAHKKAIKELQIARAKGKTTIATELVHLNVALPVIKKYPFLFLKDWLTECAKTTFDLYAYQLVDMAKNTYYYDDEEEFLFEKWRECLYKTQTPILTRIIVYLEILFEFFKWLGLLLGTFLFLLFPLLKRFNVSHDIKQMGLLWLKTSPMIGAFVMMTGGFGYARLRLPVEALMIILSLTFWYWLLQKRKNYTHKNDKIPVKK